MRVAEVIGSVTLSSRLADVPAGRFVIVRPQPLAALRDGAASTCDPAVAYDALSAADGARVAISEGREAAAPFHPGRVPIDAYCAALLDEVRVAPPTR